MLKRLRFLLFPFSILYWLAVLVRNWLFDSKIKKSVSFKIPVISVGNVTVGGTGKTPHVEYLVRLLKSKYKTVVLSRGYKRKTKDFILASVKSKVREIGDEALQLKLKFPEVHVAVDRDRVHGINRIIGSMHKPELIIMDDAFQHRSVKPGLSIVLVDYNRPVFKDFMLPAGNLREPWHNIKRADILIVTKCPDKLTSTERQNFIKKLKPRIQQEVYFTRFVYDEPLPVFSMNYGPLKYKYLRKSDSAALMVTGIVNPAPLRNFLYQYVSVTGEYSFPDHHQFTEADMERIIRKFNGIDKKQKYIFVTEKDAVRLKSLKIKDKHIRRAFYYVPAVVKFIGKGEKSFIKQILKFMNKTLK